MAYLSRSPIVVDFVKSLVMLDLGTAWLFLSSRAQWCAEMRHGPGSKSHAQKCYAPKSCFNSRRFDTMFCLAPHPVKAILKLCYPKPPGLVTSQFGDHYISNVFNVQGSSILEVNTGAQLVQQYPYICSICCVLCCCSLYLMASTIKRFERYAQMRN